MPLIIETGAGVANANSFVSVADAQAFINARDIFSTITEGLLLRAMDSLSGVADLVAKYPLGSETVDGIPDGVVRAQIWLAYYIGQGNDPSAIPEPAIKSEKVDTLQTVFAVNDGDMAASSNPLSYPNVRDSLVGLIDAAAQTDAALTGRIRHA